MSTTFTGEPLSENGNLKFAGAPYPATPIANSAQHNLALTTTGGVALTVPVSAKFAAVQVKVATASYTTDGTAASATVGTVIAVGAAPMIMSAAQAQAALFFSTTGTLDVEYFA